MFDHVTVRVTARDRGRGLCQTVLASIDYEITHAGDRFDEWNDFGVAQGYYGAFLLDPHGNSAEAVDHNR